MLTVGIDTEEIARFKEWSTYSKERLLKIFSPEEIAYCIEEPTNTAERMAARFAAKEAFYKAVTSLLKEPMTFMQVAKLCSIQRAQDGRPTIEVDWQALGLTEHITAISMTHTTDLATAIVIIS